MSDIKKTESTKQESFDDAMMRWDEFSNESFDFFFSEAEKRLNSALQVTEYYRNKASHFLSIYVPIIAATSVYLCTNLDKLHHCIPLFVFLLGLLLACKKYTDMLLPIAAIRLGSEPLRIIDSVWLGFKKENQRKAIIANQCRQLQKAIEERETININHAKLFKRSLYYIQCFALLTALSFLTLLTL
jgi:hypothetical protein